MFRGEREPQLLNGVWRVDLGGETLDAIERGGLPIYYFGARAEATKYEESLRGTVAVYQNGLDLLEQSYGEPWSVQREMVAEENERMQRKNPGWEIMTPPNPATAIGVAQRVYELYGKNVLPLYTRVGDGSLVAGYFFPRAGADVHDGWPPLGRFSDIGVLPLAVHA